MNKWINSHTINIITGIICAILGYFAPISGVLGVVTAAIFLDLFVGIMAARKRKVPIESFKLWRTIKKLFYAVLLIALTYGIDREIAFIQLHRVISFFIVGFELYSILESVVYLTNNPAFETFRKYMVDKIDDKTGIDISEE